MSPESNTQTTAETAAEPKKITPAEFLASLPGAPSPARINEWKQQVPNGKLRVFTPDGKRAYVLRGFSGLEMERIQKAIPQNSTNPQHEYELAMVARCLLWTSTTSSGVIDVAELKAGAAGLPVSLFQVISELADFAPPEMIEVLSGDL